MTKPSYIVNQETWPKIQERLEQIRDGSVTTSAHLTEALYFFAEVSGCLKNKNQFADLQVMMEKVIFIV